MTIRCRQCGAGLEEGAKFCAQCGTSLTAAEPTVQAAPKRSIKRKWVIAGLLVAVFAAGFASYLRVLLREYHPVIAQQPEVIVPISYGVEQQIPSQVITARMDNGSIVIPLKSVMERKLVRFFDPENIQQFPILSYITPEGKVVTAMSVSEHCRSTDFYLKGHNIHCASCPSYWNMSSLEAYACCQKYYPDPIPSTLVNDEIRIDAQVVRNWKSRI